MPICGLFLRTIDIHPVEYLPSCFQSRLYCASWFVCLVIHYGHWRLVRAVANMVVWSWWVTTEICWASSDLWFCDMGCSFLCIGAVYVLVGHTPRGKLSNYRCRTYDHSWSYLGLAILKLSNSVTLWPWWPYCSLNRWHFCDHKVVVN